MQGIDTCVLIRYLVQDDPDQSLLAAEFIENACNKEGCFINSIVLCELVWVLESAYGYSKDIIASVLDKILHTYQFKIEYLQEALKSLEIYCHQNIDFSDQLLAKINETHGCNGTFSFDKKAIKNDIFTSLYS